MILCTTKNLLLIKNMIKTLHSRGIDKYIYKIPLDGNIFNMSFISIKLFLYIVPLDNILTDFSFVFSKFNHVFLLSFT